MSRSIYIPLSLYCIRLWKFVVKAAILCQMYYGLVQYQHIHNDMSSSLQSNRAIQVHLSLLHFHRNRIPSIKASGTMWLKASPNCRLRSLTAKDSVCDFSPDGIVPLCAIWGTDLGFVTVRNEQKKTLNVSCMSFMLATVIVSQLIDSRRARLLSKHCWAKLHHSVRQRMLLRGLINTVVIKHSLNLLLFPFYSVTILLGIGS